MVSIGGKNIVEIATMSITDAAEFFADIKLSKRDTDISKVVMRGN